jgi:hypothetical protein
MSRFGAELGMKYDKSSDDVYSINRIDTSFFVPSRAYLEASMGAEEVRAYLDACRWRKTLYIVTGLKIARGASVSSSKSRWLGD